MNEKTFLWIIMGEEGESRKQWGANEENLFLGDRFSKQVENKPRGVSLSFSYANISLCSFFR